MWTKVVWTQRSKLPYPTLRAHRSACFLGGRGCPAALEREEIQAFFVFSPDCPNTFRIDFHYLKRPPDGDVWRESSGFVRADLVAM